MTINANTKIAAILKQEPAALEAIISISSRFEQLRNPLLRKLMAGRTSIAMASKIGNCSINAFFEKLRPLGFEVNENVAAAAAAPATPPPVAPGAVIELDVRPAIAAGNDPLGIIMEEVKALEPGQALKIINTFEPAPLIVLLERQGFTSHVNVVADDLVATTFYKQAGAPAVEAAPPDGGKGWEELMQAFKERLQVLDVRQLKMPGPMLAILAELDKLHADRALFVYHKRIPVFLLPELVQRKFDYRIKEINEGEVHLLIFKA
ncbi:MAG TPA: DUF2249 domain-containing protein [Chitinophaga sp.]|uniref:DUF2249 domain-containing protein n=1 Tax=Chitinophaga sp. TaxID=1869181 RepID=UPI002DB81892|nr:DUF2249 domain-containing protein [Chitinophaga sp.]HEU4554927.1 DUF2249 domain-containing protein [Chitinophaga sp.]